MPFVTHPGADPRYGWAMAKCDKCGHEVHIAVGFCYDELTIERKVKCAIKMGWRVAPRLLCARCKPR